MVVKVAEGPVPFLVAALFPSPILPDLALVVMVVFVCPEIPEMSIDGHEGQDGMGISRAHGIH